MNGFLEATWWMIKGVLGAIVMIVLILVGMVVALVAMGVMWIDVVAINFWVLADKILASLSFLPAPLSWALICGAVGALVHLGSNTGAS